MGQIWNYVIVVMVALVVLYFITDTNDEFNPGTLKGKNVIVTGASSGIGEELAYQYCKMGANVFITARRKQLLQKVKDKCVSVGLSGIKVGYIAADMGIMEDTDKVVKTAVATLGTIDYLILNHARAAEQDLAFWEGTQEDLLNVQKDMDINYRSFVHLTANAMRHMNKTKGAICAVSSFAGKIPTPFVLSMAPSKFALDGFFNGLRQEFNMKNDNNLTVTLAILGQIGTDTRTSVFKRFADKFSLNFANVDAMVTPASPMETAQAIIKSTTLGHPELYYPPSQWIRTACILRALRQSWTEMTLKQFQ